MSSEITVVIPTSNIPSHPSTRIIDETVASVRFWFPDALIILTFDGLRPEHSKRRKAYQEYIRRCLWKINHGWGNVVPIIFNENVHQVAMMRVALEHVKTPLILYVEHDIPLTIDCPIDWENAIKLVESGEINLLRFHFEAFIPEPHLHLMLDPEPIILCDIPVIRTVQWSQRPHLATTALYHRICRDCFTTQARTFFEDKMYGVVTDDWNKYGIQGWYNWRIAIYAPPGGNFKRSYTTDGREGEAKYDDQLVF